MTQPLTPRLIVDGADRAIAFYRAAFDANLIERYADPDGHVAHAALSLHGAVVALADARAEWRNVPPHDLGGSPVILNLLVPDVDTVVDRFLAAGGETVFPLADQVYGHREGRFRDPFGHLWMLTTIVERLSADEIAARMRA